MKIWDLVLMHKWYDMIDVGDKREEYRRMCPYWAKRICGCKANIYWCQTKSDVCCGCTVSLRLELNGYTHVRFHRGYTKTTMLWTLADMEIGKGREDWGAPKGNVFILKLGERVRTCH